MTGIGPGDGRVRRLLVLGALMAALAACGDSGQKTGASDARAPESGGTTGDGVTRQAAPSGTAGQGGPGDTQDGVKDPQVGLGTGTPPPDQAQGTPPGQPPAPPVPPPGGGSQSTAPKKP